MSDMNGKWGWSANEERFSSQGYDTREQALAAGREEYPEGALYTGFYSTCPVPSVMDWDRIAERLGEAAFEEVGDVADDWPFDPVDGRQEKVGDLEQRLHAVLVEWLTEHDMLPNFYRVTRVEKDEGPEEAPEKLRQADGPEGPEKA